MSAGGGSVSFKGIPYAEPPTGARRFRAPASHACWSGVKDAFAYGSECAQAGLTGGTTGDEDCLSLNVWVPASSSGALPVLYFIHGGAEIVGGSNQQLGTGNLYDGQALAERQCAGDDLRRVRGRAAPSTVDREKSGNALSTSVGCAEKPDVAACLRGKPAADLVSASAGLTDLLASDLLHTWDMPYGPNVDGYVLTEAPLSAFKSGRYNHVPFAVGSNAHEMELFITPGQVNTCYDYESMVNTRLGPLAARALSLYPCASYPLPRMAIVELATDVAFTCQARRIARSLVISPSASPVYRYYYTHVRDYGPMVALRAAHTAELPFVFRTW